MRPRRPHGLPSNRTGRESARTVIGGSAAWGLLCVGDIAQRNGSAVASWVARRGTTPTSSGASRPAALGRSIVFGGTQQLDAASGLLGGSSEAAVFVVMETSASLGVVYVYSDNSLYYDARKALVAIPSASHIAANNGESTIGNRNNVFAPVGTGARSIAVTLNRALTGASEFAIYDGGSYVTPDAAYTNDTTGTYVAAQKSTIGAYESGLNGLVATVFGFGLLTSAPDAQSVRRLSRLMADACGVV